MQKTLSVGGKAPTAQNGQSDRRNRRSLWLLRLWYFSTVFRRAEEMFPSDYRRISKQQLNERKWYYENITCSSTAHGLELVEHLWLEYQRWAYQNGRWGNNNVFDWIRSSGAQMFRSTGDIQDNWFSIKSIVDPQLKNRPYSGSYCHNDMDMLAVGMHWFTAYLLAHLWKPSKNVSAITAVEKRWARHGGDQKTDEEDNVWGYFYAVKTDNNNSSP